MLAMMVFQLMTYSCVRSNGFDGELMSMTCRWDTGHLYATKELAEAAGNKTIGVNIHSFIAEDRKVEKFKVQEISVIDR